MNVLVSVNSKMYAILLTLLYSMFESNQNQRIIIWLCYSDLSEREISVIRKLISKYGGVLNKLYINEEMYRNLNVEHYPKEVYFRILAVDMLPIELDRILYLDVDIIVKGPLQQLYDTDLEEYAFAACEDIYGTLSVSDGIIRVTSNFLKKNDLGIPQEYYYINSGMLLLNLNYFRENNSVKKLIDYMQYEMTDYRFPDQNALNAVLYNRIKYVPWQYYNCPPLSYVFYEVNGEKRLRNFIEIDEMGEYPKDDTLKIYNNAVIVHFSGTRKPWIQNPGNPFVVEMFSECFMWALDGVDNFLMECN